MADNGNRIWRRTFSLFLVSGWLGLSVQMWEEQRWRKHALCLETCVCVCTSTKKESTHTLQSYTCTISLSVLFYHLSLFLISLYHNLLFSMSPCLSSIHVRKSKKNLGKLLQRFNHKGKKRTQPNADWQYTLLNIIQYYDYSYLVNILSKSKSFKNVEQSLVLKPPQFWVQWLHKTIAKPTNLWWRCHITPSHHRITTTDINFKCHSLGKEETKRFVLTTLLYWATRTSWKNGCLK